MFEFTTTPNIMAKNSYLWGGTLSDANVNRNK